MGISPDPTKEISLEKVDFFLGEFPKFVNEFQRKMWGTPQEDSWTKHRKLCEGSQHHANQRAFPKVTLHKVLLLLSGEEKLLMLLKILPY